MSSVVFVANLNTKVYPIKCHCITVLCGPLYKSQILLHSKVQIGELVY
jgi:hypothetical protein